jgi:DNA helicase HerA-like ATPase
MKNKITVGYTAYLEDVEIDIPMLLRTRLLIQANSGGGKSYLIRRLAEQMFGKVPVIIIDPEGEFATLREKFGYVLIGKGGETPADLRSAAMVAHKLLELRASAVCDLYELKPQARHQWVRAFLDALIDAPKELWRPTIIVLDEAHQFSPEGKSGESEASG